MCDYAYFFGWPVDGNSKKKASKENSNVEIPRVKLIELRHKKMQAEARKEMGKDARDGLNAGPNEGLALSG